MVLSLTRPIRGYDLAFPKMGVPNAPPGPNMIEDIDKLCAVPSAVTYTETIMQFSGL